MRWPALLLLASCVTADGHTVWTGGKAEADADWSQPPGESGAFAADAGAARHVDAGGPVDWYYHSFNGSDGYMEWSKGPAAFHVEVVGTENAKDALLRLLFHRRAADLCAAKGFAAHQGEPTLDKQYDRVAGRAGFIGLGRAAVGGGQGAHDEYRGATAAGDVSCTHE